MGAALLGRWLLPPVVGSNVPLTLFVLAIAASAWFGGAGPALLATAVSVAAVLLFAAEARGAPPATSAVMAIRIALLTLAGVLISVGHEARLRIFRRRAAAFKEADRHAQERREGEARFRRIIDTAQEGIWEVDAETRTTYVNQRMAEMLGYSPEEILGRNSFDFLFEEDRREGEKHWQQRQQGAAGTTDFRFRHKDGHLLWMRASATPLLDEGSFSGAFAMFTDVTAARQGEEALRASETRKDAQLAVTQVLAEADTLAEAVRGILRGAGERLGFACGALWRVDANVNVLRCVDVWISAPGKVAEFEEASRTMTFSPGVGVPGRVWTAGEGAWIPDLAADANFPRAAAAAKAGLRSGFGFPITFAREVLGVVEFFSLESRPPDPELLDTFLGVGSQIGQFVHRKRIEEERSDLLESEQAARREAEAANRAKDEFLATLSHELRTPLNAIVGWAHLLRTGQLDESQSRRAIEVIDRNAKAQAQIVADVLDVSRIVVGKLRLELRPLDLAPVVEQALESVRPALEAKEIRLEAAIDPAGARVSGDPDRLQQVVWNLLSNAIKFTPARGRVLVQLRKSGGDAEVLVEDSGSGLHPDFLPHVFERFRQSDSSSTRAHGGLGLGLALVRHLVEMHGGTVAVTSRGEEEGASFVFRLPLVADDARARLPAPPAVAHPPQADLRGVRVLVVAPGAGASSLRDSLSRAGADVRTAGSAAEALLLISREPPEVVLTDFSDPSNEGYELIRRLRALAPEEGGLIPAAAVLASARPEDVRRALEAGFQSHVGEMAAPDELASAVAALTRRSH